jgi:phosphatidylinositol 4-kinase A
MTEWHIAALLRIAEKTPPIVLEEAHDFVTAELEYNPVLRQDYIQGVRAPFTELRCSYHLFRPSKSTWQP